MEIGGAGGSPARGRNGLVQENMYIVKCDWRFEKNMMAKMEAISAVYAIVFYCLRRHFCSAIIWCL